MTGADGSTTFTDSSVAAPTHVPVAQGDAQIDTAIKKWGTGSGLFDGTGDYVTVPDSADWDIMGSNSDDQTVDLQMNIANTVGTQALLTQRASSSSFWQITVSNGGGLGVYGWDGAYIGRLSQNPVVTASTWQHIAWIKVGSIYSLYLDGIQVDYGWDDRTISVSAPLFIGQEDTLSYEFEGNLDEVRVQSDNYFLAAPNSFPAAPLLLYGEGVDEATTMSNDGYSGAVTMSGGAKLDDGQKKFNATTSMFFDGASDYLSVVDTSGTDYDIAASLTDSWTIDLWFKPDSAGATTSETLIQQHDGTDHWELYWNASENVLFRIKDDAVTLLSIASTSEPAGLAWHHVAIIKSAANYGLYVDGTQEAYGSIASTIAPAASLSIGLWAGGLYPFGGNMEQIQITKGNKFGVVPNVGLTSTLTVPTAVLTQDTITEPTEEYSPDANLARSQVVIIA